MKAPVSSTILLSLVVVTTNAFTSRHGSPAHLVSKSQSRARYRVVQSTPQDNEVESTDDLSELDRTLQTNKLDVILRYLQSNRSCIQSLSRAQLQSIFDSVERATAESETNTVNKRSIQDVAVENAVEFQALDKVRSEMTKMYRLLREEGSLNVFGAIGRLPPQSSGLPPPDQPIFPAGGSKIITPTLLEEITDLKMLSLTPESTNFLLYAGSALAVLEGIISLNFDISLNLLVSVTIVLALMDQILVSGAVFETGLRMVNPSLTTRITKHEAGHFLCAYLLGCPVEGVVLSTWAALSDNRFGGRSSAAVSAGTSYYDIDLSEQISGAKPLTRESIDRYSIIVMGGIAAEALEYGRSEGGAGDEEALVRFLRSLNPRSGKAVSQWTPELVRNQARWGATQAVLMLKEYKPCYDALVDALERGGDLGQCVSAIENAAAENGLGWLSMPKGTIVDEGEYGKFLPSGQDGGVSEGAPNRITPESESTTSVNGVPTFGEESLTDTEEFLRVYKQQLKDRLEEIDHELGELNNNNR